MPLAGGFLTGSIKPGMTYTNDNAKRFSKRYSDEVIIQNQPILEILDIMSKEKGCSYAQMAIAWLMNREDFIVPIPGMTNEEIVRSNMAVPQNCRRYAQIRRVPGKV